jgi:hypothetical protein
MTKRPQKVCLLSVAVLSGPFFFSEPCTAQSNSPMISARWGVGTQKCSTWLSAAPNKMIDNWIWGYWSGLNTMNVKNHDVGSNLKGSAILEAVRTKCRLDAAIPIATAIEGAYVDFATAP